MKKILVATCKILSVPVTFAIGFALLFWPLYLIWLACGAYQTAAKEWGWGAGILSLLLAFVLPVASYVLWCAAFDKNPSGVGKTGTYSRKTSWRSGMGARNDGSTRDFPTTYLKLLAAMMANICKADGHIGSSKIRAVEDAFEKLGFTTGQERIYIDSFWTALEESFDAEYYASKMIALNFSYEMRIVAYEVLWDVASADGVLAPEGKAILGELERWLKLAPGTFDKYFRQRVHRENDDHSRRRQYQESTSNHSDLFDEYTELGCNSSSSDEDLKSAYRNLAKKWHPDVLRAQGMPESLMGRANERMARINAAWDKIKKARRISG